MLQNIAFPCLDYISCTEGVLQTRSLMHSLCLLGVGTPKDQICHVSGTGQMTEHLFPAVQ